MFSIALKTFRYRNCVKDDSITSLIRTLGTINNGQTFMYSEFIIRIQSEHKKGQIALIFFLIFFKWGGLFRILSHFNRARKVDMSRNQTF